MRGRSAEVAIGLIGLTLLAIGTGLGLFFAPEERFMGNVMRILYVHVPALWTSLLCFSAAFVLGAGSLWSGKRAWDAALVGTVETGVVLVAIGLITGAIWGQPTWGVWWSWDARLTFTLLMFLMFVGVLLSRRFIDDPERRSTWSAVAAMIASANSPLVYFSVRWFRSIHQLQSSSESVNQGMLLPLRINAVALPLVALYLVIRRARIELLEGESVRSSDRPPEEALDAEPA